MENQTNLQQATLGSGCFWCGEAIFKRVNGVIEVTSGYADGSKDNPDYREVSSGSTGHAEVIQITFDPDVISYEDILDIFFHTHDPTTLNMQGNDVGEQYRSIILYHNEEQRRVAEEVITTLNESKEFEKPIVTQVKPYIIFYPAEDYHQDYFEHNPRQPYCQLIIDPKVTKFMKKYRDKVKE